MKNLLYYPALLSLFLLITSCNKNNDIKPITGATSVTTPTAPVINSPECDTNKLVSYTLINSTGVPSFQIGFLGKHAYTFTFPKSGSKTVALPAGTYTVQIQPSGDYSNHTFFVGNLSSVDTAGAHFDNVKVNPCSVQLSASIR